MDSNNLPELETIRTERYALSVELNRLHAVAVASTKALNLKKGDVVWLVNVGRSQTESVIWARRITLTSLGKKQGTAIRNEDGKNTLVRIYTSHDIMMRTREEVETFAAVIGPIQTREANLGSAYCSLANFPNLYPQYREKALTEIRKELDAPRNFKVEFK